ncbi:unnamed protein product [Rotaria sordida]|uniref:Cullin family profile domain-containing protein n=1 Tax=Rotaria sordida TaxID=392033 RepID=A0A820AJD3_9BILA|nr:unnamed protein product [Rotaria sordida]
MKGLDLQGESVLQFYTTNWEHYRFSSKVTNHFCSFLNRHWVRQQYNSGRRDVYEIFTMAMKIWHSVFLQPLNERITKACLQLIKSERENNLFDTQWIKKVIESYVELGFIESSSVPNNSHQRTSEALTIYKHYFEDPFLQETERFYRLKADTFVDNSIIEYLKKVAQLCDEEVHRVHSYLHPSTLEPLIKKFGEVFICDQLEAIYAEAKLLLLDAEKYSDLALLFKVVSRVPNATIQLQKIVEDHIRQRGIDAIERIHGAAINDPELYVETILEVHTKFSKLAQEIFISEQGFTTALNNACCKFINNNAVTRAAGNTTKSSELLAGYCDALLRKGSKAVEETDLEETLNQIIKKLLAKRLFGQLSASDDYEKSMISKLKQAYGFVYTSKLQQMFQDITDSKNLIDQYRTYCEKNKLDNIVDFSVMILSSNSWSFSAPPNFVLPVELKKTFDNFTQFYTQQHNDRKLTWLHQHSKGELQMLYTKPRYILHVLTYQMVVLLLFNKFTSWTVKRMQDETQIKVDLFLQVLCGLLKNKLLKCAKIVCCL